MFYCNIIEISQENPAPDARCNGLARDIIGHCSDYIRHRSDRNADKFLKGRTAPRVFQIENAPPRALPFGLPAAVILSANLRFGKLFDDAFYNMQIVG